MRRLSLVALMVVLTGLMLVGCKKSTSITNPVVGIASVKPLTQDEVRSAVLTGCSKSGWVAKDITTGEIEATLNIRSHTAVISIAYNSREYNIKYKSSVNLRAKDGKIHPNYNVWVEKLRRNIDLELSKLSAKK